MSSSRSGRLTTKDNKSLTLLVCCMATMMSALSIATVAVALPAIVEDFNADSSLTQWVAGAYQLAVGVLLLTAGALADRFGYKRVLAPGAALSGLGALLGGLAPSTEWLIVGRFVEGAGGAALAPASLGLIVHTFNKRERSVAIGKYASAFGIMLAAGPLIGGLIVGAAQWRWVFFLNAAFGLLAAVMAAVLIGNAKAVNPRQRFDIPGQIFGGLTLCGVLVLIIGWGSGIGGSMMAGACLAAALFLAAFVRTERQSASPLINFRDFRHPSTASAIAFAFLLFLAFNGFTFYNTAFLQRVMGFSAFEAGLLTVPVAVAMFFVSRLAGKVVELRPGGQTIAAGFGMIALGLVVLTLGGTGPPIWLLFASYVLMGSGLAAGHVAVSARAYEASPPSKAGVITATVASSRMVSGAFSVALAGSIIATVGPIRAGALLTNPPQEVLTVASGGAAVDGLTPALAAAAHASFTHGLYIAYITFAAFAALGMLLAWNGKNQPETR